MPAFRNTHYGSGPGSVTRAAPGRWRRCALLVPLLLLWAAGAQPVSAQAPGRIGGIVSEAGTGLGLDRANIRVLGTTRGTITNADGRYLLVLDPGRYRIAFSVIGFAPDTLTVELASGENIERDIVLERVPIEMPALTVRPGITDLARELVRRAVRAREGMLASLQTLQFQAYTRTDMIYIDPDSVAAGEQIGGIMETRTEGFWRKPDLYLERILARRQTASYTAQQNIFASGRLPSFNSEQIEVGTVRVLSPLASTALDHYSYTILDTLGAGGGRAYLIGIEPRSRLRPLFQGTMLIADGTWLLLDVDLTGNEAANRPPLIDWRLRQQFALYEDRYWLPIDSRVRFQIDIGIDVLEIFMELHAVRFDYTINETLPEGTFGRYMLEVDPEADRGGSSLWEGRQILPLTEAEEAAYIEIEQAWAEASPLLRGITRALGGGGGGAERSGVRLFPHLRYNRIEGLRLGAGLRFERPDGSGSFSARAGYGLADSDMKYRLGARQRILAVPEVTVRLGWARELTYREGMQIYTPDGLTAQNLIYGHDPVDYYRSEGLDCSLELRLAGTQSLAFRFRDEQHESVVRQVSSPPLHRRDIYRENPPIMEGRLRSGTVSAELDTRRLIEYAGTDVAVEGRNWIIVRGDLEMSDEAAWGSDFTFMRGRALAEVRLHTLGAAHLDLIAMAGNAWGDMPPQRLFDLHGARGGEYRRGAFMTLQPGDFVGDRMGLLWLEHNFSSIPARLLGIRAGSRLDLDFLLHATVGWCGLRVANTDLTAYGARATEEVYSEMGVGLGRFMGFLRFDLTWRLAPRREGRDVAFCVGASF